MSIILFAIGKTPFFRSIFDNFIVIQKCKEKKEYFYKIDVILMKKRKMCY